MISDKKNDFESQILALFDTSLLVLSKATKNIAEITMTMQEKQGTKPLSSYTYCADCRLPLKESKGFFFGPAWCRKNGQKLAYVIKRVSSHLIISFCKFLIWGYSQTTFFLKGRKLKIAKKNHNTALAAQMAQTILWCQLIKLILLQNFMNIDGTMLILFFFIPSI